MTPNVFAFINVVSIITKLSPKMYSQDTHNMHKMDLAWLWFWILAGLLGSRSGYDAPIIKVVVSNDAEILLIISINCNVNAFKSTFSIPEKCRYCSLIWEGSIIIAFSYFHPVFSNFWLCTCQYKENRPPILPVWCTCILTLKMLTTNLCY